MKYKLPKPESRKDDFFYFVVTALIIFIVVAVISGITIGIIRYCDSYNKALDTCIGKGYSRDYCIMMLN